MSKRDSEEMENVDAGQPPKKQKLSSNSNLAKEASSTSVDMIGRSQGNKNNKSDNIAKNANKNESSDEEGDQDDDIMANNNDNSMNININAITNISNIGKVNSIMYNQIQSLHILGNNTVELSRSHNDGTETKLTEQIIQSLTQFMVVSNMQLVVPNIMESKETTLKRMSNENLRSNNVDSEMNELKSNHTHSSIMDETEDNIEEITRNDEICHNKLADLLRYNLQNSSKMGERKIRKINIVIEGAKGTRANKFRSQSIANTPSTGGNNNNNSNNNFNSNASFGSLASCDSGATNLSTKNRTDRLILYRDEINEKLFEYSDIILLFPDDNFDVLLNLFEYLRLCELGRTRNTSNPLFSEGIDSMGKVLIFNLNGFYNGLNKQFNCYDEDKVENRFVVVVVDTVQEGIERLKMWNRDI